MDEIGSLDVGKCSNVENVGRGEAWQEISDVAEQFTLVIFGPGQTGTGIVGYSDSWVQGQTGTVTDGYRCDSWVQGQSGTEVGDSWVQGQSGTGVGDSWVQGQTGTSGATNGYSDKRVQVRQTGTATNGYKKM